MATREKKTLTVDKIVMVSNRHFNVDLSAFPDHEDIIDMLQDRHRGSLDIEHEGDGTYTIKSEILTDIINIANECQMS